jgi:hypothetical protein
MVIARLDPVTRLEPRPQELKMDPRVKPADDIGAW